MKIIRENWLGVLGLVCLCVAIPVPLGLVKNALNIIGFLSLISYAWMGKNDVFFYFEIVALFGYLITLFGMPDIMKYPLLAIACIAALSKVLSNQLNRKWYTIFCVIGLGGLVYGYAAFSNLGYAIGGVGMVIYSAIGYYKGVKVALIFGVLNIIYGGVAIFMLMS
jgi:hypothetical protein